MKRRIALIHDWFTVSTGSEKVVEQILNLYPDADVFCIVDFLPSEQRGFLTGKSVQTSFIQKFPWAKKKYRNYIGLMPLAVEQFDLSSYDLVISSCHAVAKGVITGPDQLHISYVHTPMRYAWDMQTEYLQGMGKGLKSLAARLVFHYLRIWDSHSIHGVDQILANSNFVAERIRKIYCRDAKVIYPPVDTDQFTLATKKDEYYLVVSRLVQYKKVDSIVQAFARMPEKKLIIIGDGPDKQFIETYLTPNISLMGYQSTSVIVKMMQNARALITASKEDFGITAVEAQACGTPVIAYGRGGALETIKGVGEPSPTGVFFKEQTPEAIRQAVRQFEESERLFVPENCREQAMAFSKQNFCKQFLQEVEQKWGLFTHEK